MTRHPRDAARVALARQQRETREQPPLAVVPDLHDEAMTQPHSGKPFVPTPPKLRPIYWPQKPDGTYFAYTGGHLIEIMPADDGLSWHPLWSLWIDGKLTGEADEWTDPADAADEALRLIDTRGARWFRWAWPVAGLLALVGLWVLL